jgi:hypothetical protein
MKDAVQACQWLEKTIALDEECRRQARDDARFQALLAEPGSHGAEPLC